MPDVTSHEVFRAAAVQRARAAASVLDLLLGVAATVPFPADDDDDIFRTALVRARALSTNWPDPPTPRRPGG